MERKGTEVWISCNMERKERITLADKQQKVFLIDSYLSLHNAKT
jgi:hypothetical protein